MLNGKLLEVLHKDIHQILRFEDKNLIHRPEWMSISFESIETEIKHAFDIARKLNELDLRHVTDNDASEIIRSCNRVAGKLAAVDLFEGGILENPREIQDSYCNDVVASVNELTQKTKYWITYLPFQNDEMSSHVTKLRDIERQSQNILNKVANDAESRKLQMDEILGSIREGSAAAGIGVVNNEFREEDKSVRKTAIVWLVLTTVLALGCLVIVGWSVVMPVQIQNEWVFINTQISKWSLLVVLGFGTIWCGRMYRSLMHQSTINRQKAMGLQTFQAFTNGAADDSTKDAVLLATTNYIFGNHATGMLDQKTSDKDTSPRIFEFSRFISSQTKVD